MENQSRSGKRTLERPKVRLTKSVIATVEPEASEYVIWDSRVAGFGLRVRPTGAKSFVFVYRTAGGRKGKSHRVTIKTDHPDLAFEKAKELAAQHHGGRDPAGELATEKEEVAKARRALTVGDVLDAFIEQYAKPELAPKTSSEYERICEKMLKPAFGSAKIASLDPPTVAGFYRDTKKTPTQAALAVRVLSSAMSWAEEHGLRPPGPNPARIRLKGARRRERLFTEGEVSRLTAAMAKLEADEKLTGSVALGLRLLFETGCRASEIASLQWSQVDYDAGVLRLPKTKTSFWEKPLIPEAVALLEKADRIVGCEWVCPGSNPAKHIRVETLEAGFERVMKEAGVVAGENATLHLIRHWFSTKIYTDSKIALPVQMAIVGHKSVATAMRYAHTNRDEVVKAAAEAGKRRAAAVKAAAKGGRVVPIKSAERA